MNYYLKELAGIDEPVRETYYKGKRIDEVLYWIHMQGAGPLFVTLLLWVFLHRW